MNESDWLRHLLPLPREISIPDSVSCRPDAVRVVLAGNPDDVMSEAAAALEQVLEPRATAAPVTGPQVTVTLGRVGDVAAAAADARLPSLAWSDQAYRITSVSGSEIVIAGVTSAGTFYGAMTLAQLLTANRRDDSIEVPLPEIVDWPAFDERGLWNFPDAAAWIPWMAGMKLNYGKMADTALAPVARHVPAAAVIDTELCDRARRLAFRCVPYILHLNFLHDVGLFRAYPELAGKGDAALAGRYFAHKQGDQHRAPCASQPVLVDILADWLRAIAAQGAGEISCWLSERPCQCECERCTPVGQFLLETRAFLAAWRRARHHCPGLRIRIFSSTTTPQQDDQILAELPEEVKFERGCATAMERTRHRPRDRFANALLDEAAAAGRWIASYDVPIGAYGNVDTPEFKVPQFGAQRIRDFVAQLARRRYAGAYGMLAWAGPAREICGFSVSALAEYSWNPEGRDIGAFATAWATLEGIEDPAAVGAWATLLGEIEFDVYDADFPASYSRGRAAAIVEKRQAPRLGEGLFRHFADTGDFGRKQQVCQRARGLVEHLQRRDLALATDVVRTYVALAGAIWSVAHRFAHADLTSLDQQRSLQAAVSELDRAGASNIEAIRRWRADLGPEPWHHRVHDAIAATRDTVHRIAGHIRDRYLY